MNSLIRFGMTALIIVVAGQSAGALRCLMGGQMAGMQAYLEKTCNEGDDLCQYQNGTMGIKIAKGCAKSTHTISAVNILDVINNSSYCCSSQVMWTKSHF